MNIKTTIIADSVNPNGGRLTSFLWEYPRFIHSEVMTHRDFSRNAASSRAIPFIAKKPGARSLTRMVMENPAMPEYWGLNEPGMQAKQYLTGEAVEAAARDWLQLRDSVVTNAEFIFESHGLHKQLVNRLIEPWARMIVLVTSAHWENFFSLRAHPDAQPEFQVLAYRALARYLKSTPRQLAWGEWHLPFGERVEGLDDLTKLKVVTARCARLSYLTFDGNQSIEDDIRLHDGLKASGHMSPFEHAAQASADIRNGEWGYSNFGAGWLQYRKMIAGERRTGVDLEAILASKPDWVTLESDVAETSSTGAPIA